MSPWMVAVIQECVFACVCVCERERERERAKQKIKQSKKQHSVTFVEYFWWVILHSYFDFEAVQILKHFCFSGCKDSF